MKLKALLRGLEGIEVYGSKEVEISGMTADSRTAAPGNLFVAKRGTALDGTQFVRPAVDAGAVAVLTDVYDPTVAATQIVVKHVAELEPFLVSRFFGHPSRELFVAGITGTKGKTTTTYLTQHLLNGLGKQCGLISTVETILGGEHRPSTLTTHSVVQNHKFLKEAVARKDKAVALEVSSHGLAQHRVDAVEFDVAVCTNIFPDHLDYHHTMEEYVSSKGKLFELLASSSKKKKRVVVNVDDERAYSLRRDPCWTFGIENNADIRASDVTFDATGTRFMVSFQNQQQLFTSTLMGRFNVYNLLAAMSIGLHLGATLAQIAPILATFRTAPGRLQQILNPHGILTFVDYAHNGEALASVLRTLREIAKKRIICLFGCGGNRDPARRPEMARAAEQWADITVVTSDNPRTEDPMRIIEDILGGFKFPEKAVVVPDRREAIAKAISLAQAGDIVLIAGKGHEKVQIFGQKTVPFDDVVEAEKVLKLH